MLKAVLLYECNVLLYKEECVIISIKLVTKQWNTHKKKLDLKKLKRMMRGPEFENMENKKGHEDEYTIIYTNIITF